MADCKISGLLRPSMPAKEGELMKMRRISREDRRFASRLRRLALLAALPLFAGCVAPDMQSEALNFLSPPPMRWDHRPEASHWTAAALVAVAEQDDVLAKQVPADIATWCPGYEEASLNERRAFWVGLMSALAKHESTWNPRAAGGGGKWIGLLQIAPGTARSHSCDARSAGALKDGAANLTCAVDILVRDVANDGMVAGGGAQGLGRDWAPFRKASKRADMAAWTSAQPYCRAG
jgi:hypothetical protein